MKYLSEKGQEAAPFELLIAVILMGFVIVVGIYATTTLEKKKCGEETNKKLEDFKEAVEAVAKGKGQYSLNFVLPPCAPDIKVKLEQEFDPYLCSVICGGSRVSCTLLRYTAKDMPSMVKCINISPQTEFVSQNEAGATRYCEDRSAEDQGSLFLEDWDVEDVRQGDYILVSAYAVTPRPIPVICAYRKEVK